MITFEAEQGRFNYRVVGIALHGDRVLLHQAEGEDFWTLPGGRGEFLEPSTDTLRREMREELHVESQVERLVWFVENFFEYNGRRWHELALYFLMTFPEDYPLYGADEPFEGHEEGVKLIFQWFRLDELQGLPLYPSFLKTALASLPAGTEHVVHSDTGHIIGRR